MNQLNNQELLDINGGAFSYKIALGITALGIFVAGFLDGFLGSSTCKD